MTSALPLRVRFAEDEAPYSLLARMALRHSCPSIIEFLGQLQRSPTNLQRLAYSGYHVEHVAHLAGQPAALLTRNAIHPNGGDLSVRGERIIEGPVPAGRLNAGRVCAACLSDDLRDRAGPLDCRPYRRFWWDLTVFQVCPVHAVKLLKRCPQCHKRLSRYSMSPRFCPCGVDLAAGARTARPPSSAVQSYLLGRLEVGKRVPHAVFDQLPWDLAAQAIDYFGRAWLRANIERQAGRFDRMGVPSAKDEAFAATGAAEGFAALLRILSRDRPPTASPARVYAPLLEWLRRSRSTGLDPLRLVMREEAMRQFAFADRTYVLFTSTSAQHIKFSTAAKRIGVSVPRLRNLFVEFGHAPNREEARAVKSVSVETCKTISRSLESSCLTTEAAAVLGISEVQVRKLIAQGALRLASRRAAPGLLRIKRASLEQFRRNTALQPS